MIGLRSVYGIFVLDKFARSALFVALSALSFPCIPMWLGTQVRMMLLFLESVNFVRKYSDEMSGCIFVL